MHTLMGTGFNDVWTVIRKELREFSAATGLCGWRGAVVVLALVALGGFLPTWLGDGWLMRPALLWVWLLLPMPLVIVAVAESFAGERERHTLETLLATRLPTQAILQGKVIAATIFGWGATATLVLAGMVAVALRAALAPGLPQLVASGGEILGLSFLVALFTAVIGVLTSQNAPSARAARTNHSLAVIGILLAVAVTVAGLGLAMPGLAAGTVIGSAILPFTVVAALFIAVDIGLYTLAAVRFSRSRLIAG